MANDRFRNLLSGLDAATKEAEVTAPAPTGTERLGIKPPEKEEPSLFKTVLETVKSIPSGVGHLITHPGQTLKQAAGGVLDAGVDAVRALETLDITMHEKLPPQVSAVFGHLPDVPGDHNISEVLTKVVNSAVGAPQTASEGVVREIARYIPIIMATRGAGLTTAAETGFGSAFVSGSLRDPKTAEATTKLLDSLGLDTKRVVQDFFRGDINAETLDGELNARLFNTAVEVVGEAAAAGVIKALSASFKAVKAARGAAQLGREIDTAASQGLREGAQEASETTLREGATDLTAATRQAEVDARLFRSSLDAKDAAQVRGIEEQLLGPEPKGPGLRPLTREEVGSLEEALVPGQRPTHPGRLGPEGVTGPSTPTVGPKQGSLFGTPPKELDAPIDAMTQLDLGFTQSDLPPSPIGRTRQAADEAADAVLDTAQALRAERPPTTPIDAPAATDTPTKPPVVSPRKRNASTPPPKPRTQAERLVENATVETPDKPVVSGPDVVIDVAKEVGEAPTPKILKPTTSVFRSANAEQYRPLLRDIARQNGVDNIDLFDALIARESAYNPKAVSRAKAKGLGQLMDATAQGLGVTDSYDPIQNLQGAARHFRMLEKRYGGSPEHIVAAYNAGQGRIGVGEALESVLKKTDPDHVPAVMKYYAEIQGTGKPVAVVRARPGPDGQPRIAKVVAESDGSYSFSPVTRDEAAFIPTHVRREFVDETVFTRLVAEVDDEAVTAARHSFINENITPFLKAETDKLVNGAKALGPDGLTTEVARTVETVRQDPLLKKMLTDEAGITQAAVVAALARSGAGAVVGGMFGDTPEERLTNALIGGLGGLALSPAIARSVASRLTRHATNATDEVAVRAGEAATKTATGQVDDLAQASGHGILRQAAGPDTVEVNVAGKKLFINPEAEATPKAINEGFKVLREELDLPKTRKTIAQMKQELGEAGITPDDIQRFAAEKGPEFERMASASAEVQAAVQDRIIQIAKELHARPTPAREKELLQAFNAASQLFEAQHEMFGAPLGRMMRYRQSLAGTAELIDHMQRGIQVASEVVDPKQASRILAQTGRDGLEAMNKTLQKGGSFGQAMGAAIQAWYLAKGTAGLFRNAISSAANTGVGAMEKYLQAGVNNRALKLIGVHSDTAFAEAHAYLWSGIEEWRNVFSRVGQVWKESAEGFASSAKAEGVRPGAFNAAAFGAADDSIYGRAINFIGEKIVSAIPRVNYTVDELAQGVTRGAEMRALGVQASIKAGIDDPLKQRQFIEAFIQNPPAEAVKEAAQRAKVYAFNNSLYDPNTSFQVIRDMAASATKYRDAHPFMRFFVPFIQTPTNAVTFIAERTPGLNLLSANYRRALTSADPAVQSQAVAKMLTGVIGISVGYSLYEAGWLNGHGPLDPRLRQLWRQENDPHALKIGDQTITLDALDPLHQLVSFGATLSEAQHNGAPEDVLTRAVTASGLLAAEYLGNVPFLRAFTEFTHAVDNLQRGASKEGTENLARALQAFSPLNGGPAAAVRQAFDQQRREWRDVWEMLRDATPGVSKNLPGKYDALGHPVYYGGGADDSTVWPYVNLIFPLKGRTPPQRPVVEKLVKDQIDLGNNDPAMEVGGVHVRFEKKEIDRYYEILRGGAGTVGLDEALNRFMSSPGYTQLPDAPDGFRELMVKQFVRNFTDMARKRVLAEHFTDILTRRDNKAAVRQLPQLQVGNQ